MDKFEASDWANIAQTTAAIIGIAFLIINLLRTNKMIELQAKALRNISLPVLSAFTKVGFLPEETQKKELFPLCIKFNKNDASNVMITFSNNDFIDISATFGFYDLRQVNDRQIFFDYLESGSEVIIRAKVKNNAPRISDEFENIDEYNSVMKLFEQEILIDFQDINGYKYSQTILWNGANFDRITLRQIKYH